MAVTVAVTQVERRTVFGDRRIVIADLALSGTYVTGGTPLAPSAFGLVRIDYVGTACAPASGNVTADVLNYDYTNAKLVHYESGAANAPFIEKNSGEALIASQTTRVLVVGV